MAASARSSSRSEYRSALTRAERDRWGAAGGVRGAEGATGRGGSGVAAKERGGEGGGALDRCGAAGADRRVAAEDAGALEAVVPAGCGAANGAADILGGTEPAPASDGERSAAGLLGGAP